MQYGRKAQSKCKRPAIKAQILTTKNVIETRRNSKMWLTVWKDGFRKEYAQEKMQIVR